MRVRPDPGAAVASPRDGVARLVPPALSLFPLYSRAREQGPPLRPPALPPVASVSEEPLSWAAELVGGGAGGQAGMLRSHLGCRAGTCALGHRWAGVRALTATSPQQPHSLPYEGRPALSPRTLEIPAGGDVCASLPSPVSSGPGQLPGDAVWVSES